MSGGYAVSHSSGIVSISTKICICAIIVSFLSVLLGFDGMYSVSFDIGVIAFLPVLFSMLFNLWRNVMSFINPRFFVITCIVFVVFSVFTFFLYPDCYGEEVDYKELCVEGSTGYVISIFVSFCYVILFFILGIELFVLLRGDPYHSQKAHLLNAFSTAMENYANSDYANTSEKNSVNPTQDIVNPKNPCGICGKGNVGGRVAKGVQKTVGNTIMGICLPITMLTGGWTAPAMLGLGLMGGRLSASAENYSFCSECRTK